MERQFITSQNGLMYNVSTISAIVQVGGKIEAMIDGKKVELFYYPQGNMAVRKMQELSNQLSINNHVYKTI